MELKQNKEFLALEEQEKILARLKEEEKTYLLEKRELLSSVKKSLKKAAQLLEIKDVDECVAEYKDIFERIETAEDTAAAREVLEQMIRYKKKMYDKVQRKMAEEQIHLHARRQEMQELEHKISDLGKEEAFLSGGGNQASGGDRKRICQTGKKSGTLRSLRGSGNQRRKLAERGRGLSEYPAFLCTGGAGEL